MRIIPNCKKSKWWYLTCILENLKPIPRAPTGRDLWEFLLKFQKFPDSFLEPVFEGWQILTPETLCVFQLVNDSDVCGH